jgi:hypothetical protein
MTNDEMQRLMEFIVTTEARSSAKIEALLKAQKEVQKANNQRSKRSDERWKRTETRIRALLTKAKIRERGRQISEGRNGKP